MTQINLLNDEMQELVRKRNAEETNLQNAGSRPDYERIQNRLTAINEEIAVKQAQLAAAEAQETVFNQFEQLDFGGGMTVSLREACANEEYYQLLSMWMQNYIGDQAQKHAAIVNSYKSEIEAQEDQLKELDFHRSETDRLGMLLADMTAKREAAAAELDEFKQEVERLTKDNESLRAQLEGQNAPSTPQVDPAELYRRIQAAKPGIYNKRWGTKENGMEDRRFYAANLSTTGEEISIPLLEIGKYREESQEEAERFRTEQAQLEAERLAQETLEQVISVPSVQFPDEEGAIDSMDGDTSPEEVVGETVTRAEFEEVKTRLARIEDRFTPTSSVA
jgi:tetrahydromethanopterin S-methyltransferase subunit G